MRLQCLAEEIFRRRDITAGTQPEINGPAFPVNGPVKIGPDAADLDIGLVSAPGLISLPGKAVPAALKFGDKTLHPAHDRRVGQRQATLSHHLHQIPETQLVTQVQAHTQDDDRSASAGRIIAITARPK